MSETVKCLAQSAVPAALTAVYTVPAVTRAVVSSLILCNRGVAGTYRIQVAIAGAASSNEQYLVYDAPIDANDTVVMKWGLALGPADVVRVHPSHANMSVNLFGAELA